MRQIGKYIAGIFLFFNSYSQNNAVVIGYFSSSDDTVRANAAILAQELQKGGVKNVSVKEIGNSTEATIVLAPAGQLIKKGFAKERLKKLNGLSSEAMGITGTGRQVFLTGNSSLAVQHAVFRYLHHLGFRYYFPQEEWFVYPEKVNLVLNISYFSQPVFSHRRLWYAYGTGTDILWSRYAFWEKANCLVGAFHANIGHAYDQIVERHKADFLKHPEWLVNSKKPGVIPDNPKFDVTKQDLIKLIIDDTREQIQSLQKARSPAYKMISLSPSDDIGFCNTPACQKLGSVSDRVFHLINEVAKNIKKDYPNTLIGCLAYSEYIAPPAKPVQDNVYVSLTTAFNESKYSLDKLTELWKKKVRRLGIYDYQALYAWDYDLPGQCMASAFHTIAPAIKKYNKAGLIGYESEINTGWINKGLGYYLTSRLLWDPSLKEQDIIDQFFTDCFASSAPGIKKLFTEWSRFNDPFISQGVLARWIDIWNEALKKEKNPKTTARLAMIGNYLQYLIVYNNYKADPGQANLEILFQYAKLHLNDESVTYYPAMLVLGSALPNFNVNTILNANKTRAFSYSPGEVIQWLQQYRAGLKKPTEYRKLSPGISLAIVPGGKEYNRSLHDVKEDMNSYFGNTYFVFDKKENTSSYFEAQANFAEGGGTAQPVVLSVYPFTGYNIPAGKPLKQVLYTDRKKWNRYSLAGLKKGLYVLKIEDPKKGFQLRMSADINYSLFIPDQAKLHLGYIHSLYFYVPPGTGSFKFLKTGTLKILDPYGKVYDYGVRKQTEVEIYPDKNQAGIWRLMFLAEYLKPEGICPVFGVIPSRMLYPKDIKP